MEAIYIKNTCYLHTEKHREIGREHREFNLELNVATLKKHDAEKSSCAF